MFNYAFIKHTKATCSGVVNNDACNSNDDVSDMLLPIVLVIEDLQWSAHETNN